MKKLFSALLMGVFIMTSMSIFTSCKDYDDEINAAREDISQLRTELSTVKAALETELKSQTSTFETQIAAVKKELQDAIDKKADETTVSNLQTKLKNLETDYAAKIAVLTTQIETASSAIARIDQKADQSTVDAVLADLAALTGKLTDESKAREAVEANLRIQMEALEKLKKEITDANYQSQIDQLIVLCQNFETSEDAGAMKEDMKKLQQQISSFNEDIDALRVLIERMLNSISLVPSLFIDGIEAIEFTSLEYKAFTKDQWDYWDESKNIWNPTAKISNHANNSLLVSDGMTEATYRLNPTTVQRDGIDEQNIEFLAARAETRGAAEIIESPVAFKEIKEYKNGLMTVYLQKKSTASLNESGNKITIVALKVPRNAQKYEAADVISENSRLAEISYTPRIAALDGNGKYVTSAKGIWTEGTNAQTPEDVNKARRLERPHHYWSFYNELVNGNNVVGIYNTQVDAEPSWSGVAKDVVYTESFDLSTLVTGCLLKGSYDTGVCQKEITKEQLKKFGMVFKFDLPNVDYHTGAENLTNQQAFAKIDGSIITSRTPEGLTNNEAVVGKEPIVRVQLVDEKNGKIVDVRYFKIKWVLTNPDPIPDPIVKPDVELDTYVSKTVTMNWCDSTYFDSINWEWWVNKVYAKLKDLDYNEQEIEGMAQHHFKDIYTDQPKSISVTYTTNWNPASDTNVPANGSSQGLPVWFSTDNYHGDALRATWGMWPQDIGTVYCNSQNDTKTFTALILFESKDRTKWPNLKFKWTVTVKLPELSKINGFYEQYWLEGQMGKKHDIMPVQYNTDYQQRLGNTYCLYHNNLMNPFTYYQGDPNQHFIVTPFPECGTWDLQFNYKQTLSSYAAAYIPGNANATENGVWKSKGLEVNTKHGEAFASFGAYKLNKGNSKAIEMLWDDDHASWCGNPTHYQTYLFADHYNGANQGLLNPLGQDDEEAPDHKMVPKRTHDRPIDLTVWVCENPWNYVPVLSYQAYMVAPLRIDWKKDLGPWYEGYVNGYTVDMTPQFTLTDFRGYRVSQEADNPLLPEQERYTQSLWKYYEIGELVVDTANVAYAFKRVGNDVIVDDSDNPTNWMKSDMLYKLTNGNIAFSMVWTSGRSDLTFFNNGGSNIEKKVKVRIPVSVTYGFGKLETYLIGDIYPRQKE